MSTIEYCLPVELLCGCQKAMQPQRAEKTVRVTIHAMPPGGAPGAGGKGEVRTPSRKFKTSLFLFLTWINFSRSPSISTSISLTDDSQYSFAIRPSLTLSKECSLKCSQVSIILVNA